MGLAASQARLLSITQRMSDNELRAELINNQKMRLAADSSKVSENYIAALNKTNLLFSNYDADDNAQNVALTFNALTAFNQYNNQYGLVNTAGNILISEAEARKYQDADGKLDKFLAAHNIEMTTSYWDTIGEQLKDVEAYYSNPDMDGYVEPDGTAFNPNALDKNETTDGTYTFFTASQLKAMYEGTYTGGVVQSYEDTIKTQEYGDFVGYVDNFVEMQALMERSNTKRSKLLGAYIEADFTQAMAIINGINASYVTNTLNESNTGTLIDSVNTALQVDFTRELGLTPGFDFSGYKIPDWDTLFPNMTYNSSDRTWNNNFTSSNYFGANKTNNSTNPTTYSDSNLYYKDTLTGKTYVQVPSDVYGETSGLVLWVEVPQPVFPATTASATDTKVYKHGATGMTEYLTSDGSNPLVDKVDYNSTTGQVMISSYDRDDAGNKTSTVLSRVEMPKMGSGDSTIKESFNAENFSNKIRQTLLAEIRKVLEKIIADGNNIKYEQINGPADPNAFTEEEKKALSSTTVTEVEMQKIFDGINDMAFNPTGDIVIKAVDGGAEQRKTSIEDPRMMAAFLNAITSGTWDRKGPLEFDYYDKAGKKQHVSIPKEKIKDSFIPIVNAYVLDTLMDYFGEPKYTYLYTDGKGDGNVFKKNGDEYVKDEKGNKIQYKGASGNTDASDEAQWYINLFTKIQASGYQVIADGLASSKDWLQFALENGIVTMVQVDSYNSWQGISYTSCSDISEQTDKNAAAIAEAEYNKAMNQIEAKDEMFDLELKNIDTEHTSLQNEYESVKKAMTGNIERTFQMYS